MMLTEELGLSLEGPSPLQAAASTCGAFVVVGCIPLLPFSLQFLAPSAVPQPLLASTLMTAAA